jgi:hypothetical protein
MPIGRMKPTLRRRRAACQAVDECAIAAVHGMIAKMVFEGFRRAAQNRYAT